MEALEWEPVTDLAVREELDQGLDSVRRSV